MSSSPWRAAAGKTAALAAPRLARILAPGGYAEAKPVEWREIESPGTRAAAQTPQAAPDLSAQMDLLRQQCEQRVSEAHAAGVRESEAAAKTRASAEVQAALEKLAHSTAEIAQMRPTLRKQAESDTIKLALAVAKRILRREIAVDPDAIRGLVVAALEKLQTQEIHRVRASAPHAPAMTAILRQTAAHASIEVIADASLAPGTVVFETNQGNLDASVDSQLREIERGLADHLRKRQ
jgi:flagellar assembly protein FliH